MDKPLFILLAGREEEEGELERLAEFKSLPLRTSITPASFFPSLSFLPTLFTHYEG